MTTLIAIIFAIIILIIFTIIAIYNGLVRKKSMVEEAWSGIDVQLKRRYNLIPALIETVKSFTEHESEVFENVSKYRQQCLSAGNDIPERAESEKALASGLKSVFALAEAYPELKSNENYIQFQKELSDIEEQVQMARRYYNGSTRELNIAIDSFPSNLVANAFNFSKREFFEVEEQHRSMPEVKFS
ncbi:LemA family protein [Bacteriovorax sp. DB6_IX]|uniref:LemA family protein n=1 Tax=Bacteriovorax sp. DB6_IX TaxID=1353530 RepID=UPI00038A1BC2|nr:LemA family protein [Bacteriovorax sp. DB6_IX]EQC51105.1 LemA family protein [Bacteriovorax sp. DB6_IX]